MVSGRAGIGLIDSLFNHGLTPASTISNVIILCQSEKKKKKLLEEIVEKNYQVSMDFIVYDQGGKYLKKIESKVTECLNSTHKQVF